MLRWAELTTFDVYLSRVPDSRLLVTTYCSANESNLLQCLSDKVFHVQSTINILSVIASVCMYINICTFGAKLPGCIHNPLSLYFQRFALVL